MKGNSDQDSRNAHENYDFNPNESYHEAIYSESWKRYRSEEYFEYRRQWDEVPRDKVQLDFPIHLDIETTNICNLKCPMCPRTIMVAEGVPDYVNPSRMSREDYANIIDQGAMHGLKSVKLNYLSEPLAHKDVIWQVEYAKKSGIVDVMMNTNAALLKREVSEGLLRAGLDNLFVSIDAVSPDMFEERRPGTTLGRVMDNLHGFIKLRNKSYPHVQVRVSMIMYNDPVWMEQFEGLKTTWKGLVDAVGYGFYTERAADLRGEYPEQPGFWCAQPFQRMFLKNNGNVTICCVDDKDEVVVGDWRTEKLHSIWNSPRYRTIRQLHADGKYYQMALCRKCYLPHSE